MYLFIGILLGSIVTSTHDNREQCEGRATILKEKGVTGQCVQQSSTLTGFVTTNPSLRYCNPGQC